MSNFELILPFERGRTACDGVMTPTADCFSQYVGKEYQVPDTVHGTGKLVRLKALRLEANITVARKFFKYDGDALDLGQQVAGVNDAAGGLVVALDDAYTVGETLLANDIAYFIIDGPCYETTELSSVNLAAAGLVVSDNAGYVDGAAPAAGNFCVGRIDAASTTTNATVVVHITPGLAGGEGA